MRDWLKQIRKNKNMTQQEVAKLASISRTYYTRIENGEFLLPVETAKKIAVELNFDWNIFYEDKIHVS